MKLTRHNGRAGKHGAYNPKHNDRRFDLKNSDHIREYAAMQNLYWDCYQGFHVPLDEEDEKQIVYSFEQVEQTFYRERYEAFCEGQHERNRKTGHTERDRTTEDLRKDRKTCPEESLIQIGTVEKSVAPEILVKVASEFFEEFQERFGRHVHILDWSLHLDEATPHIHERHVFDCENRYGEIAPQQEKALECLGFELPDPDKKPWKQNNRKMVFDAACRAMLFEITKRHGLHLDREPEYGGRDWLEKQDYILQRQKETIAVQDQEIASKKDELEELTIRIADTETFVSEVADAAFAKAAETVTKIVREEVRNEDFDFIAREREKALRDPGLGADARKNIGRLFANIMDHFRGMTEHITKKIAVMFRDPVKRNSFQEPVRKSIRAQLEECKREADSGNARRKELRKHCSEPKHHDLER